MGSPPEGFDLTAETGEPPPAEGATTARPIEQFDRSYTTRIMVILAGLVMIVMYIEGMLTPSLPSIAHDFNVSVSQVSLVLSVYLVTGVALSPIAGKLGDIYGKKRVLVVVLALYTVAVSVTGFSPTFSFMVGSRAVQGIGLTVFPLAMSLVREEFPREMVPRAMGLLSALFGAGFAISLPLGSWVSGAFGWRATYHSAIPFVAAVTILCIWLLRESPYRRPNAYVDYPGAGILAGSLALIVLALSEGPVWGWTSGVILGMFLVGGILMIVLVFVERRRLRPGDEVILNIRLLRRRNVMVTNLILTIAGFGMFLAFQALTFRLEYPIVGFGLSIFQTGLSFVAFAGAMLLWAPIASLFVSRTGTKPLTILGLLVGAGGFFLATRATTLEELLAVMFMIGSGLAVVNASVINLLVLTVEPRDMGLATSMNAVFRNVGSAVGAPLAGSLMSTFTVTTVVGSLPDSTAFDYAYLIAAAVMGVAAVVTLFAREVLGKRAEVQGLASDERPAGSPLASAEHA